MDEKKKSLLAEDSDKDSICSGLAQLAEVCSPAVDSLAGCKGREYADNLVAIHVNSMSGGRQSTPFPTFQSDTSSPQDSWEDFLSF